MLFLLQLAGRNLLRNTRRSLLSMIAVVAGVWVLILGQAFIGGLREGIIRGSVDSMTGHVLIRPKDYPTEMNQAPVDALITVTPDLAQYLDKSATAWTTRLVFAPKAIHGQDAVHVRGIGFDVTKETTVFPRDTWHLDKDGKYPTTEADGALIGQGVARVLDIKTGDILTLEARTPGGAYNALQVPVAGVFTTGNPALDHFGVFVPMDLATDLIRPEGKVSHIAVRLNDREDAETFATALRAHTPADAEVTTWVEETHDLIQLQEVRKKALDLLVFVLLGMSATSIFNTIMMAAYERVREIGTLRAMGMDRLTVIRLFVLEGAMMGWIGGVTGAILGAGMAWYWSVHGIDLTESLEKSGGSIPISSMLYLEFQRSTIVMAVWFGVAVAVGASVWPAIRASAMQPADAVKAD